MVIFQRAESGHGELVDLFSAVLLRVLFCIVAPAIVQKITEPTLLCIWAGHFQQVGFQSVEGSIVATAVVGVVNVLMTGFQFR